MIGVSKKKSFALLVPIGKICEVIRDEKGRRGS